MKYGHFEMVRLIVGRKIDTNTMFAQWRIDTPWLPVTKKVMDVQYRLVNQSINYCHIL
jgi:hypothetical protein